MDIKKILGEKIKRLRKKRNYTQEELAEMIEISPRNLSRIEVGESFLKAETFSKLLNALEVSTEELFANDHIKDSNELLAEIYSSLNLIKDDTEKLEKIYKMIRIFIDC